MISELSDEELTIVHIALCELRGKLQEGVEGSASTALLELVTPIIAKIEKRLRFR